MDKIEEKIWAYGTLSLQEKRQVDQFVSLHPEYATLLGEIQDLYKVLAAAGFPDEQAPADLALAYYVAHEIMTTARAPVEVDAGPLEMVFAKLKRRLEEDRDAHARYLMIKTRMEAIAADADPVAQFEKLTGDRVEDIPIQPPTRIRSQERDGKGPREDRPPTVREPAVYRASRGVFYSLVVLGTALVLLLHVNRDERLGYMDPGNIVLEMPAGMRGIDETEMSDGIDTEATLSDNEVLSYGALEQWRQFRAATEKMLSGQAVYFGIYYTSDAVAQEEARRLFESLLAQEAQDTRVEGYAKLMLAKIHITNQRNEEATLLLREIVGDAALSALNASLAAQANALLAKL